MNRGISFDRSEETPEAKARWFQSLSLKQRMDLFCEFTNLVLELRPGLPSRKEARPTSGRVLVLESEPGQVPRHRRDRLPFGAFGRPR
jgi:hypothetical protein